MKRDDFGMRIDEIRELATKHSKEELKRMVQMNMLEPQKALLAGMMIDRIINSAMQPPRSTVFEDTLTPKVPTTAQGQLPPGIMGAPGAPQPSAGVAGLPSNIQNMAGGGIVAFADGGQPQATYLPDNIDFAKGQVPVYRAAAPKEVTLEGAAQESKAAETAAGMDPNFYENLRKDVLSDKEDFTKQREEAKGAALMRFGLGLMGARKGQEFQAAGLAGQQALADYGATLKEIKAAERDMKKTMRDLSLAEQAYKKTNSDKYLAKVDDYKNKLQAQEENYAKALNEGVTKKVELRKIEEDVKSRKYTADVSAGATRYAAETAARSHEKIAAMPGAEQKLLTALQESPALMETFKAMKSIGNKEEVRAKTALALAKEYNDLTQSGLGKMQLEQEGIKTAEDYIQKKMELFERYYRENLPPRNTQTTVPSAPGVSRTTAPQAPQQSAAPAGGGVVVQTPQGPVRFNTQAEADAYRQRVGLR